MLIDKPASVPSSIPLIDLHGASVDPTIRANIFRQVHRACREMGFFYVTNHGIPADICDDALAANARLMAAPSSVKHAIDAGTSLHGYEAPARQVLDPGSPPDLKESFQFSWRAEFDRSGAAQANRWPTELLEIKPPLLAYMRHIVGLGRYLMKCLAGSLDLPADYFDDGLVTPSCSVRALRYPPLPTMAGFNQLRAGAHTDWGAITLLLQDEVGGLEVQNAAGNWLRATPIPGSFIVNLGDMVCRWTNDLYHSTRHRVQNNRDTRDRYSIACFYGPDDAYRVTCVPSCMPEAGEPNYAPCTVGEHFREMVRLTYGGVS